MTKEVNLLHLVQKIESADNKHRRRVIIEEIARLGITPIIDGYSFKELAGENIMTTLPGKSTKTIVLTSHSDTFPGSPGANDDASGCAVLIDLLRRLKDIPLQHSVKWLIFDQEEEIHKGGAIGSQAYAKRYQLGDIVAVINPELVGRGDAMAVWSVDEDSKDGSVLEALRYATQQAGIHLEPLIASDLLECDYQTFREAGIHNSFALAAFPSHELETLRKYLEQPVVSYWKYKVGIMEFPSLFKHYHNARDRSQFVSKQSLEMTSDVIFNAILYLEKYYAPK